MCRPARLVTLALAPLIADLIAALRVKRAAGAARQCG
jgi:hypothetical protein